MESRWSSWVAVVAAGWNLGYLVLHAFWAIGYAPTFARPGESYFPGGWVPVVIAVVAVLAAVLAAVGARRDSVPWFSAALAWVAGGAMLAYSFMFAVSLLGLLTGEFTGWVDWGTLLARASGVIGGLLTIAVAVAEQRRARRACPRCGRVHGRSTEDRTDAAPEWAFAAAYIALAGCVSRLLAEVIEQIRGGDRWSAADFTPTLMIFTALFVLAGTVLPLALVHRWGRIWPRWVFPLAGRPVPRWVVLGPAFFIGAGLTAYFGIGASAELFKGDDLGGPLWWIIMVIPGYIVWGLGLLIAAVAYFALTKPECALRMRA